MMDSQQRLTLLVQVMLRHKAQRLNLLARLAALQTQSKVADLQLRQQLLQKQQLANLQLQSYQNEYLNKQTQDTGVSSSISMSALKNNSRFMADLNHAVIIQQQQLKAAEQVESMSRADWAKSHAKELRWQDLERIAQSDQDRKHDKKEDQENIEIWSARHSNENT